jgi:hypothetical protein
MVELDPPTPGPDSPSGDGSGRTYASLDADRPAADPSATPADAPLCEAGCGRPLSAAQLAKGAKACSAPCRAKAHREGRRARRLAEVDASIRGLETALEVLRQHRAEIARG